MLINQLEDNKIIKEKYRNIFKMLPKGLQETCRVWAQREGWDETTWLETLEALIRAFSDYREAEKWIRREVLHESVGIDR